MQGLKGDAAYLFLLLTHIVCFLFINELNFASPIISILNVILMEVMVALIKDGERLDIRRISFHINKFFPLLRVSINSA